MKEKDGLAAVDGGVMVDVVTPLGYKVFLRCSPHSSKACPDKVRYAFLLA